MLVACFNNQHFNRQFLDRVPRMTQPSTHGCGVILLHLLTSGRLPPPLPWLPSNISHKLAHDGMRMLRQTGVAATSSANASLVGARLCAVRPPQPLLVTDQASWIFVTGDCIGGPLCTWLLTVHALFCRLVAVIPVWVCSMAASIFLGCNAALPATMLCAVASAVDMCCASARVERNDGTCSRRNRRRCRWIRSSWPTEVPN